MRSKAHEMLTYLVKRVITMIMTLVVISVLVFIIIKLPPGDYLSTYIEELKAQASPGSGRIDFLRKRYGPICRHGTILNWATGLVAGTSAGRSNTINWFRRWSARRCS
jgi:peptide/nickel transport system permease protein